MSKELEVLKNEYASEIFNFNISSENLIEKKIPLQVLRSELFLSQIYGDKIDVKKNDKSVENKQKSIIKISLDDIGMNADLKEICSHIESSEFDEKLGVILRKYEK